MSQELLDKIANAAVSKGGNYLQDGDYEFILERVEFGQKRKGVCFVPELRVVRADKVVDGEEPNPVGSTVSCVWNVSTSTAAPGNIKEFILALTGLDESAPPAQVKDLTGKAYSPEQPFRGIRIAARTFRKTNQGKDNPQNRGQIMVIPKWRTVQGQTAETVAQGRAMLDGTAPAPQAAAPPPVQAAPPVAPTSGFLGGILK
jgi:hypothetical protein